MDRHGVSRFEDAYDAAGIRDDSPPPELLRNVAAAADVLCTSDLRRAIESLHRVAPGREVIISPLLREIRLEPPSWIGFQLPISAWDVLSHAKWSYRLLMKRDHECVRRADAAADWLEQHARDAATVVVLTHGGFRRFIADRLTARGWQRAHGKQRYANWSVWELQRRFA
jgi:broad specificity phosphatase PhoE